VLLDLSALKSSPRSDHGSATSLRDLLARDPVCCDIVRYLMRHTDAADTARGIAEWWIGRDLAATQDALLKLQACGVVRSHVVQERTFVYAYTKRAVLRQTLARYLQGTSVLTAGPGG
jgi:hypothetical protein